jgi:dienelactone hydrolase
MSALKSLKTASCVALFAVVCGSSMVAPGRGESVATSTHRATRHPMRYHVALPEGWVANRSWPTVVVIPDAARDFEANLLRFVRARGSRPYILVAAEVLSCGGARTRTSDLYTYSRAEWDSLQGGDDFAFEDAGLAAVLEDVHQRWGGEPKAFLTGWEAGGHTVWAQALRHPERWRGVAPVTSNYQRRGLDARAFSHAPERTTLPIQPFRCGAPNEQVAAFLAQVDAQMELGLRDAREHGFHPRPTRIIAGADHGPLPEAVLAWCDTLRGDIREPVR